MPISHPPATHHCDFPAPAPGHPQLLLVHARIARIARIAHLAHLALAALNTLSVLATATASATASADPASTRPSRPHIVWIVVDDMSPHLSCYGETAITTPHIDRLAREGTRFSRAYVTAPVCSPCRSALITGFYQTTLGAHHHRSGRGTEKIRLPDGVVPVPARLREAGYFTCIGDGLAPEPGSARRLGKTDYNFDWDPAMYDGDDWAGRTSGQPFFMQVQLPGGKLRGGTDASAAALAARATRELGSATSPASVRLPPCYPSDPVLLRDWAAYLDSVRFTDAHVGRVLARLESENLLDDTLIVFLTDNGISHARGKQFLYDEGTHIPLIIRGPGVPAGSVRHDLVEHIDVAALTLAGAGLPHPPAMQAQPILAAGYRPRDAVFAARDRCDETVDHLRSVRTDRFLYIRNGHPHRPLLQPNAYKDRKSILETLHARRRAGTLDPVAERLLFSPSRPAEELYEYQTDRWQLTNLAADPAYQNTLADHRQRLDAWRSATRDPGPEPESRYDSEMDVYLREVPAIADRLRDNIRMMKAWAAEGK